jgi:hypothetical protein
MAFMWFLGYDIDEVTPGHSILSKARTRFGPVMYQQAFTRIVRQCVEAGIIDGDQLFLDASLIRANAAMSSLCSRTSWRQLDYSPDEYVNRVWADNEPDNEEPGKGTGTHGALKQDPSVTPEEKPAKNEKWVCKTDPDASLATCYDYRGLLLSHKAHVAVHGGKTGIIQAVLTTGGDKAECQQVGRLIDQHRWNVRISPQELVADRGYGTTDVYRTCKQRGLLPSIRRRIPWKRGRSRRKQAGFVYDPAGNRYICPRGKTLPCIYTREDGTVIYRASMTTCRGCPEQGRLCRARSTAPALQPPLN